MDQRICLQNIAISKWQKSLLVPDDINWIAYNGLCSSESTCGKTAGEATWFWYNFYLSSQQVFFPVPYSCILLVKDKCQIESEKED